MHKLRWGVLGTGRIVAKGGLAIQQSVNGEWLGVAGRTQENSSLAADAYDVPRAYDSYQALLDDPDIEAVYIALLPHLHVEWTIRALQAGKHVLLEKPFCLNAMEAERMLEAAATSGRQLMEAHVWRFQQAHHAAKEKLLQGEIGEICEFRGHFSFMAEASSTRLVKEWGGGALYDIGCYPLAWSQFYLDAVPIAVDGSMVWSGQPGVDRRTAGTLHFADGRTAFISSALDMGLGSSFEVLGTKGRLTGHYRTEPHQVTISVTCGGVSEEWTTDRIHPYRLQAEAFAEAVLVGRDVPYGPEEGLLQARLFDALFASDREKRRVYTGLV